MNYQHVLPNLELGNPAAHLYVKLQDLTFELFISDNKSLGYQGKGQVGSAWREPQHPNAHTEHAAAKTRTLYTITYTEHFHVYNGTRSIVLQA